MTAALGQQVVVENRTGASGASGSEYVAKASPDGDTILQVSAKHTVAAALSSKLPYNLLRDFTPVTQIANAPNAVIAHRSLPAKLMMELVKLTKSRPGRSELWGRRHLCAILFCRRIVGLDGRG